MYDAKREVSSLLACHVEGLDSQQIYEMLEVPPNPEMGDLALPCFKLSRILRKSPVQIAEELAAVIPQDEQIERIESVSGYLNFFLNRSLYIREVLAYALKTGESYGSSDKGKGKTIVIDYSSPNIAKPFHVGHLRSTSIGNSLYRIFEFTGYRCVGINYLGDWGTQFGKLITAYKHWGSEEAVKEGMIKELVALYVRFHQEAEEDPSLEDEARQWFVRLEQGDEEARRLWQWFIDISMEEYQKVYKLLDVTFDSYKGESFYNDKMQPVIQELKDKKLLKESQGAMIVDLEEEDLPPCLILKSDGSTLYATRDITAAIYRKNTYDFEKCIYVTGVSQSLHFKQWFKVIEKMGYDWHRDLYHVPFGTVSIGGEKLATRTGKVVLLEEILSKAIEKTLETIEEKNPNLENKLEVAQQMGVGAVIFSDLFSNRIKDVSFSWDEILNFDGETGPYVQYTHARACSVLRKAEESGIMVQADFDSSLLSSREEYQLVKTLADFSDKVLQALENLEPSVLTRYLVDAAQDFNRFYHEHSILVEDQALRNARLALVRVVKTTLSTGLRLIGLHAPERV
ncbi:MAG: arginine--tRNA ligase [Caldicoprobacterales bacterium]|jgi:arginyl-tRNA synthetase